MEATERHLRLLTETIAAVNSTLDLEEVLHLVATKVAQALEADACFVYLYDERSDELVLRATHGTPIDEMSRRPRMRPGEGITGSAASERTPVMIPAEAHLDPRFKEFANLPESEYESILAVPILARRQLAGALNVRTLRPRVFRPDEIELLEAIAERHDVGAGVIDVKSYYVETPDDVVERIDACLRYVPAERLSVSPDCGLSQTARWAAQAKLEHMVEGARRVRER